MLTPVGNQDPHGTLKGPYFFLTVAPGVEVKTVKPVCFP